MYTKNSTTARPNFETNFIIPVVTFKARYRPQTKFAKVMFSHVSVILSTGGCLGPHLGAVGILAGRLCPGP